MISGAVAFEYLCNLLSGQILVHAPIWFSPTNFPRDKKFPGRNPLENFLFPGGFPVSFIL